MIKRIIFDLDNTLVPWKQEYSLKIKETLDSLNIEYTEQDYKNIDDAFDEYENKYLTFDRNLMVDFINKYTKKQYPKELVYNIIENWTYCHPEKVDENILKTLEYLSSKYEMVILTDWFKDVQANKLERLGMLKYFKNIYTAERVKRKPYKEAFLQAVGENKPEECLMLGDSIERDIKGALNCGLQAIWFNEKNKVGDIECKEISKIEDLMDIL